MPAFPPPPDRRDFLRALALGGSAGLTVAASPVARADEPKPAGVGAQADTLPTEIDARMAMILSRFGGQLDEEARRAIRDDIAAQVRRAEALRTIPLDNGTGPFPVFLPYRVPLE